MILGLPGKKIEIEAWLAVFSGGQRKELGKGWLRTIDKAEVVLPFQIWNNLGFPKKVIVTGEFNGDEMMYWRKKVG